MAQPAASNPNAVLAHEASDASTWVTVWRRFRRHKLAMAAAILLLVLYAVAIFAPTVAPHHWDQVDTPNQLKTPSLTNLMGTDHLGRDVFSRIVWGSRVSLAVGFVAAGIAVTIGTLIGAVAGYYGGWVDMLLSRIIEAVQLFPVLFLLITISSVISRSIFTTMVVIGITSWPGVARIVRGQFLSLSRRDYVEASHAMGARDFRVIFRHILPNAMAPIIVSATLRIGNAILTESSLAFLGLGAPPPYPTWGGVLDAGRHYMRQAPWITTFPGIAIFLTVICFNFVGDGLRDALDPKLKR